MSSPATPPMRPAFNCEAAAAWLLTRISLHRCQNTTAIANMRAMERAPKGPPTLAIAAAQPESESSAMLQAEDLRLAAPLVQVAEGLLKEVSVKTLRNQIMS